MILIIKELGKLLEYIEIEVKVYESWLDGESLRKELHQWLTDKLLNTGNASCIETTLVKRFAINQGEFE